MAATPSIVVIKEFTYRGNTAKRFSNRYHFSGGTPANSGAWDTLRGNVVTAEKAMFPADTHIVEVIGYAAGSDVPVYQWNGSVAGTWSDINHRDLAGDSCFLIRYATTARTTKNHPVYLFNYFHRVTWTDGVSPDTVNTTQRAAAGTYAAAWVTGFTDGSNTLKRAGPNGATAVGYEVDPYVRHRDFPT